MAAERRPASDNSDSESNNDCATEMEDQDDESIDGYPPLGMWCLT